ncbi:MAG: hypothetical protein ACYS80_21635 [Planctomycetota bacterium]|jgi:hypothetical protein
METKENASNDDKFCGTEENKWRMPEMMAKCCEGMSGTDDCRSMMAECMKKCRWFPLIPVVLGILLLLLGYYLDAEITRILWMITAGFLILVGTFGFMMMSLGKRTCC